MLQSFAALIVALYAVKKSAVKNTFRYNLILRRLEHFKKRETLRLQKNGYQV
ncbi:MAG: hypothetical protein FMNOHCHN_03518 [Ignavibacteriaceae bacterium]|nr:hypothetical protein [Ignavibacteriaceae bacterium]